MKKRNLFLCLSIAAALCGAAETSKSVWSGKQIWWCGTSIPAAGFWDVGNPKSYPLICGKYLGAKVFNEAVGSSCAAARGKQPIGNYEVASRRMGDTVAEKLEMFNDCWILDDAAKTVVNGPRKLGISALPRVWNYSHATILRMQILSCSYEIKLIAKYLLKDPKEHEAFLRSRFGKQYDVLTGLHPKAYAYQGDIDLFVFDHSNNDRTAGTYRPDDRDIATFCGALNTYVGLVQRHRPQSRFVFLSNYTDNPKNSTACIRKIAEFHEAPFLNLAVRLPMHRKYRVQTHGYWDKKSIWRDSGLEISFDEKADTWRSNANWSGRPVSSWKKFKAQRNLVQIDGVWHWSALPTEIFMRDGLHPHSDASGKCLNMIARSVAAFLNGVGPY